MNEKPQNEPLDLLDPSLDSLDGSSSQPMDIFAPSSPNSTSTNTNSLDLKPKNNIFSNISPRTVMIVSAIITVVVLLITSLAALLLTKNLDDSASSSVPTQDVEIFDSRNELESDIFSGSENALFVNGDIIADGSLSVNGNGQVVVIQSATLSDDQTITLPNSSGTLCLDSNNCDYVTLQQLQQLQDQIGPLQNQLGQIIIPNVPNIPASSLVNNQQGAVSIQGTSNRVSVVTSNGIIKLSTPQDLATVSSPNFANLVLSGNLNVGGNVILPLNCTTFLNGGALSTNANGRIICTDDEISGAGTSVTTPGGTPGAIPIFSSVDEIEDSIISQALGTITIGGSLDVSTNVTFSNLANGFLRVNGSGAVSVNTIDLGTDTDGNYILELTAGNGLIIGGVAGEGWIPNVSLSLQSNKGLEVDGNGLSLVDCTDGQILKYNGSNQWACAADGAGSGVTTIGTIDSQTKSADGAVIDNNTVYLQTADATNPGLVSTGSQTFGGAKTFNAQATFSAAGTGLSVTNNATIGGQVSLTMTGSSGGITIGGDINLYRSGANILATDDIFEIGTLGSADTDTVLCHNSLDQIATCNSIFVTSTDLTLQAAYDGGNTVLTTDGNDIDITLANTTTDPNFTIDIATGSTGEFQIEANGTDILQIGATGQLQLDVQGSSGGILLGGDALIYRGEADLLETPDSLTVLGTISSPGTGSVTEHFGSGSSTGVNTFSLAIGTNTSTTGSFSTAVGQQAAAGVVSTAIGGGANANAAGAVALGESSSAINNASIAIGRSATTTATNQLVIGSSLASVQNAYIGNGVTNASPTDFALHATGGSGTDIAGADITIAGGRGTGSGDGGNINFQVADPGTSGSSLNSLSTVFSLSGTNGAAFFQNTTDSPTAFQVQNTAGDAIFNIDTSNALIEVADGNGASGESYVTFNNRVSIGYDGNNFDDAVIIGHTDKGIRFFVDNTINAFTLSDEGYAIFQNGTDSPIAFQVQDASSGAQLTVDTANSKVVINRLEFAGDTEAQLHSPSNNFIEATGQLAANWDIFARLGDAGSVTIGQQGPSSEAGIKFEGDTDLYRSSASNLSTGSGDNLDVNGSLQINFLGGTSSTNGVCHSGTDIDGTDSGSDRTLLPCNNSAGDIAEWYEIAGNAEPGELLVTSNEMFTYEATQTDPYTGTVKQHKVSKIISKLERSTSAYQNNVIGVISTSPVRTYGADIKKQGDNPHPVALKGRVPVKATADNGKIMPGDRLVASDKPGYVMKATGPGFTVGVALSGLSGGDGMVEIFVGLDWYDPTVGEEMQGGSNFENLFAQTANITNLNTIDIITEDLAVTNTATIANLTVTSNALFEGNITVEGHIVTAGDTPNYEILEAVTGGTVKIIGNDTSGTIVIETSADTIPGAVLKLLFSESFSSVPQVVISPSNDDAAGTQLYKSTATNDEVIFKTKDILPANKTLKYDYIILE